MKGAPANAAEAPDDRDALIARTLQISVDTWRSVLAGYRAQLPPAPAGESADGEIARCLAELGRAFRPHSPHEAPVPASDAPRRCPACGDPAVRPVIARQRARGAAPVVYGRCERCGHGAVLDDAPAEAVVRARHFGLGYYRARDADGVGYDGYDREAAYREAKGARLVERMGALCETPVRSLLEVGSGYGYTRVAAERAGLRTAGVDLNADACAEAARRYGLATFCGSLDEALASTGSGVTPGAFDAVLYQFVLEHIAEPVGELARAGEALAPGGWLVLLLPSMEAAEIEAFGASYRSFRADHLHLVTRESLAAILTRAGFGLHRHDTSCNLHLLAEVLSPRALEHLYQTGRGPDLFAVARRLT